MMDAQSFTPPTMDATLVVSLTALVGITLVVFALLRAWQDWLALKNRELDSLAGGASGHGESPQLSVGAARIELADMKERIKKLEAIASGVEL
ncbi:MAG: hypothetical protein AAF251_07580 [Pseudomonadota bacterium]